MKQRRALSTVVGGVFFLIVIITAATYLTSTMNLFEDFSENVFAVEQERENRKKESFDISRLTIENNQINLDVFNSGDIPIFLTRLWIENVTGVDQVYRFDLNQTVTPGDIAEDILQFLPFTALETESYKMKLVTNRGMTKEFSVNSSTDALHLQLFALPEEIPNDFKSTILLSVTNNSTQNTIYTNILPILNVVSIGAVAVLEGPLPDPHPVLEKGNTAFFEWTYRISGDEGDRVRFEANILNGVPGNIVTKEVTIKIVKFADQSTNSLESGFLTSIFTPNSVLFFHKESIDALGERQMWSSSAEDSSGEIIDFSFTNPIFYTNSDGNVTVNIPDGDWNTVLRYISSPMPETLIHTGSSSEDMAYHFEEDLSSPLDTTKNTVMTLGGGLGNIGFDNSNDNAGALCSSSSCNIDLLVAPGVKRMIIVTIQEEGALNPVTSIDITGGTNQGILVGTKQVGSGSTEQNVEMWRIMESDISGGTNTITVHFTSISSDAGISVMSFSGVEQQPEEAENSNSVTDDASITTGITTLTDGALIVSAVGNGESSGSYTSHGSGQTERHDFDTISARHAVTTEIKSSAGFDNQSHTYSLSTNRQAQYVAVFERAPNSGSDRPIWNSTGHDGAGAYIFSGNQYAVIDINDDNDIDDSPATTAGWFYAYSTGPSDYQTIYFGKSSSGSDDYEIYLDPSGQLVFRVDAGSSTEIATCVSNVDYRDDTWHHFVAVYPSDNDCKLYVDGLLKDSDFNSGTTSMILSGNIQIGAVSISPITDGFHGMIDDIIHWDGYGLNEGAEDEVFDLFNTNYGVDAHHLDFDIRIVGEFGNDLGVADKTITQTLNYSMPYSSDFGEYSAPTSDIWGQFNFTASTTTQRVIEPEERLMINMTNIPKSIGNLDFKMVIDDTDVVSGLGSSFLQTPFPDIGIPGYAFYDNSATGTIGIFNPGPQDNWIKYQSRVIFEDEISGSPYAAFIINVNGTSIDPNRDSPPILADTSVSIEFEIPRAQPGNTSSQLIPEGRYGMFVFLDGYDSEGKVFLQTSLVGIVRVG